MSRAVVDAKEFSHAMSKVSKILKKCAIPILEEVCLRIQNGRCTLTATDLETWFTAELPASGDDTSDAQTASRSKPSASISCGEWRQPN